MEPETIPPREPELYERAIDQLLLAAQKVSRELKSFFKPFDLTPQQHNVLSILKAKSPGACSAQAILDEMQDKTPDLTRLLERLKQKGLIKREVCEDNRRKIDVSITYKGLDLLEEVRLPYEMKLKELMPLDDDEAKLMVWLLRASSGEVVSDQT